MKTGSNHCTATVDAGGVPYHCRLKRLRQLSGKSAQELAKLLGISIQGYYEWEDFEGELTMAMSLTEILNLSSVLGIPTRLIFEDKIDDRLPISSADLVAKIILYLNESDVGIDEFENRVGFEIESSLKDVTKVMDWNVDCLRFVCAEIDVDWLLALP